MSLSRFHQAVIDRPARPAKRCSLDGLPLFRHPTCRQCRTLTGPDHAGGTIQGLCASCARRDRSIDQPAPEVYRQFVAAMLGQQVAYGHVDWIARGEAQFWADAAGIDPSVLQREARHCRADAAAGAA